MGERDSATGAVRAQTLRARDGDSTGAAAGARREATLIELRPDAQRAAAAAPAAAPITLRARPSLQFVAGTRYDYWGDLADWRESDIDANASRFRSGIDVWIVQTFLHVRDALRAEGWTVELTPRFVPGAICVAHWDELHRLRWRAPACYLVGARADRPPLLVADQVVLQNTLDPDTPRYVGIPNWPQPGLRPRRPERGDRVRRVGYFGRLAQAPTFFADPAFRRELDRLGLEFVPSENDWQDYRDIDVVIAFRTAPPLLMHHKPVTKLSNAWLAGVPAIVGPEPAYLQLAFDPDDMVVAPDAAGVIAALRRLVDDPAYYRAMRERAKLRAPDYDVPAIRARWLAFLRERVAPAWDEWRQRLVYRPSRYNWYLDALLRQRIAGRRFRAKARAEAAAMRVE